MRKKQDIIEIKNEMLKKYLDLQLEYVEFTNYIENKVKNLLTENNIKYQAISSRVKTYESLEKKLTPEQINGICRNIMNLNDLSGIRVVFYDEKAHKYFLDVIRRNFKSVNIKLPKDILNYDGINVIVSVGENIPKFDGMLCEIQLTTVISHAMNEFSHNIVYKDIDELESKNQKEYKAIKEILAETKRKSLEIISTLEILSKRIDMIKKGVNTIETILSQSYIDAISDIKDIDLLENVINDLIEIIPLIVEDEKTIKRIQESKIINKIVKKFIEIPEESATFFKYDTYDYRFDKLLEFLLRYMYLWIIDFREIIETLNNKVRITERKAVKDSYYKFIKQCIINDKINSRNKKSNFAIHQIYYEYIMDETTDKEVLLKMNMATNFCDFNYTYTEQSKENEITIVNSKMQPNKKYIEKVENVIKKCCKLFLNNQEYEIFSELINMIRGNDGDIELKLEKILYDFIYDNYKLIDEYYKNHLYCSIGIYRKDIAMKHKLFIKLKEDKFYKLFSYLFNYFIDDMIDMQFETKEEQRWIFLDEYIKNFKTQNEEDIIKLDELLKKHSVKIDNIFTISKFFIKLGKSNELAKELYNKTNNKYLLIGIIEGDNKFIYKLENKEDVKELLVAMNCSQSTNKNILDTVIIKVSELEDEELDKEFAKVIFNRIENFNVDEYRNFIVKKIKIYNDKKMPLLQYVYFRPEVEKFIVDKMEETDMEIIINNYRYCDLTYYNKILFKLLFEKKPEIIRKLIDERAKEKQELSEQYDFCSLKDANNYGEEIKNNLILCIKLLKEYSWYNVREYIKYLLGDYNQDVEREMLIILEETNDRKTVIAILDICRILHVSIEAWKTFEKIIENVEEEDNEILDEIDCMIFNTGAVWGEYGISDSFKNKAEFFSRIKTKNQKVKKFAKQELERFKYLHLSEKMDTDKEIIYRKTEYEISNKNIDKKTNKGI